MLLERCIEKIEKHNHKNPNKVIFVNFNNTEHLKAFKEHFVFGSNFVGVAANKGADILPTYDEILDVIENSANNTFVEGIGQEKRSEYVRLHAIRYLNAEQCHRALDYLSHGL